MHEQTRLVACSRVFAVMLELKHFLHHNKRTFFLEFAWVLESHLPLLKRFGATQVEASLWQLIVFSLIRLRKATGYTRQNGRGGSGVRRKGRQSLSRQK